MKVALLSVQIINPLGHGTAASYCASWGVQS